MPLVHWIGQVLLFRMKKNEPAGLPCLSGRRLGPPIQSDCSIGNRKITDLGTKGSEKIFYAWNSKYFMENRIQINYNLISIFMCKNKRWFNLQYIMVGPIYTHQYSFIFHLIKNCIGFFLCRC